ncbi:MAG: hypothetical protein AAF958_04750, partial [Planctomycetota bacterium]
MLRSVLQSDHGDARVLLVADADVQTKAPAAESIARQLDACPGIEVLHRIGDRRHHGATEPNGSVAQSDDTDTHLHNTDAHLHDKGSSLGGEDAPAAHWGCVMPGGETVKNSEEALRDVLDQIDRHGLDRRSYVMVIGGGAVLDAAGFSAALAHRGIRLVRLPTTTLAQADSG